MALIKSQVPTIRVVLDRSDNDGPSSYFAQEPNPIKIKEMITVKESSFFMIFNLGLLIFN